MHDVRQHRIKEHIRQEGTVTRMLCKFADCGAPVVEEVESMSLNAFLMGSVEVLAVENLL